MKYTFSILILFNFLVLSGQELNINVSIDSLKTTLYGSLRKAVLFRENLYVMIESERINTSQSFKKMIVLNMHGDFIEDVFVPEEIQDMPHYELIVQHDSLFVKETQFDKHNYALGEYVADLKLIPNREFAIYEDDDFTVFSNCNGEFGGTVYFQDRQTKAVYEATATCPIVVNKILNEYYITNYLGHMYGFSSVIKISDPKAMQKSRFDFNSIEGSRFFKGLELLFDSMEFYIPTSFMLNSKLLHLYSSDSATYIGEIVNGKIIPQYKFEFLFYAKFNQKLRDGTQILTCYLPKNKKYGILIIQDHNMKFKLFK